MDSEDDGMNPWDRDELDLMMEDPWEEEQLGPPEEEQPDPPEAGEVEEPTAPIHDTSSAPTDTAAAAPVVALVLPVSEELSDTPKRPRPVEPTAPTDAPLLAEVLESPPKLRRLQSKTFVPQYVCPTKTDFRVAWDKKIQSRRGLGVEALLEFAPRTTTIRLGIREDQRVLHQARLPAGAGQDTEEKLRESQWRGEAAGRATCFQRVGFE